MVSRTLACRSPICKITAQNLSIETAPRHPHKIWVQHFMGVDHWPCQL